MNTIEVEGIGGIGNRTRARALILKDTRVGDIPFPLRFTTQTDLNHATRVVNVESSYGNKMSIPFISKVYGVNRSYDKTRLTAIAKGKSVYEAELDTILKGANRKSDSLTALLANIDPQIPITDTYDDRFIMLQTPLDVVSIFDSRHIGHQEFEERLRRDIRLIDQLDHDKVKVARIIMRQSKDALERKLKVAFGMEGLDGVFLQYANPDYAYEKLALLRSYINSPKWIHMFGVPKWATDGKTSMAHVLPLFGMDSISLRTHKPFEPNYVIDVKRLNWRLGGYLEFPNEYRQTYGEKLDCMADCPPDHSKTVQDILDEYSPEDRLSEARIHEAYESQYAFMESRMGIMSESGALFKLYKSKALLKQYFHRTDGIDFNINPLIQGRL